MASGTLEYTFAVRTTFAVEARNLFFVTGTMRWGAVAAIGHSASGPGGFAARIAAVESVLVSAERHETEVGLGFAYADRAELASWLRLPLVGGELTVRRPRPAPVVVVDYDDGWPAAFRQLEGALQTVLGGVAVAVHHVGSTAVPGLAAKPIIDIDVEIPSRDVLADVIERLARLGYTHQGDGGDPGKEMFGTGGAADVPRDGSGRRWPSHNLYVCASDCEELRRHIVFRDWLRTHPQRAADYGALKQRLAAAHRDDRERYIEGKTALVEEIMREARGQRPRS